MKIKNRLMFLSIFALLIPTIYANGGCIKVADGIFVQLSSSPLVPIANKQASFLISFGNQEGLINEEITGRLWITKNDENILTKNFNVKDGILDLKYMFKREGLYEIFLEFDYKNRTYAPEDFLIEIIAKENKQNFANSFAFLIIGIFIGAVLMKFIKKQK